MIRVFSFLPFRSYVNLALVCRAWQKIIYEHVLYKSLHIRNSKQLLLLEQCLLMQQAQKRSANLAKSVTKRVVLELPAFEFGSNEQLDFHVGKIINFARHSLVKLSSYHLPLPEPLIRVIQTELPYLTHVELDATHITSLAGFLHAPATPNLTVFSILKANKLASSEICSLFQLPQLKSLTVHEASLLEEEEFLNNLVERGTELKALELQSCPQINAFTLYASLYCCAVLESLMIVNCGDQQYEDDELVNLLRQLMARTNNDAKQSQSRLSDFFSHILNAFDSTKLTTGYLHSDTNLTMNNTADMCSCDLAHSSTQSSLAARKSTQGSIPITLGNTRQSIISSTSTQTWHYSKDNSSPNSPRVVSLISPNLAITPQVVLHSTESLDHCGSSTSSLAGGLKPMVSRGANFFGASSRDSPSNEELSLTGQLRSLKTLAYSDNGSSRCLLPLVDVTLRNFFLETSCYVNDVVCRNIAKLYTNVELMVLSSPSISGINVLLQSLPKLDALNTNGTTLEVIDSDSAPKAVSSLRIWHAEDCRWKSPNIGSYMATMLSHLEELSISLQHSPAATASYSGSSTVSVHGNSSSDQSTASDSPPSPSVSSPSLQAPSVAHSAWETGTFNSRLVNSSGSASGGVGTFGSYSSVDDTISRRYFSARQSGGELRFGLPSSSTSNSSYSLADQQRDIREINALVKLLSPQLLRISLVCHEDLQPLLDFIVDHCVRLESLRILDTSGRCFQRRHLLSIRRHMPQLQSLDISIMHGSMSVSDIAEFLCDKPAHLFQFKFHGELHYPSHTSSRSSPSLTTQHATNRPAPNPLKQVLESHFARFRSKLDCWHTTSSVDMWQISEHSAVLRGWVKQFETFHLSSVKPFIL